MHKDNISKYVREIPAEPNTDDLQDIVEHHGHMLFLFGRTYYCFACERKNNGHEEKWKYTPEELRLT